MLNIMRADIYRILRGKGVYITMIALLLFIGLQVAVGQYGTVGVDIVELEELSEELSGYTTPESAFTGGGAPFYMLKGADNLLYFMLPFIAFIVAADFSSGAVKNALSAGTSRASLYMAKLMMCAITCLIVMALNIIIPILVGTIMRGFGEPLNMDYIVRLIKPFLAQYLLALSVTCVGVFIAFALRSTAALNSAYIAFCLVPMLIMTVLFQNNSDLAFLLKYDIPMNMRMLAHIDNVAGGDVARAFCIAGVYIVASIAGGIVLFGRAEIK